MYCSACGVAVTPGLTYCNYCGAKLSGANSDDNDSSRVKPGLLVSAMVGLFILGTFVITLLMGMMKVVVGFNEGLTLAISLLAFMLMLAIEGVLLVLLRGQKRGSNASSKLKGQATSELDAAHMRTLTEPVGSVTENTTRAFEPIYKERSSK